MAKIFAIQRLIVNIPEFEEKVLDSKGIYVAENVENGAYNITRNQTAIYPPDKNRVLKVNYTYSKYHQQDYSLWADLGKLACTLEGYRDFNKTTVIWENRRVPYGYSDLAALSFHENLHLIGFNHPKTMAEIV